MLGGLRYHVIAFFILAGMVIGLTIATDMALRRAREASAPTCAVGAARAMEAEHELVRTRGDLLSCRADLENVVERCYE